MKKTLLIWALLFTLYSCKKVENNTEQFTDNVEFFSNTPNTVDGVVAKTQIKNSNTSIYFYGSFNTKGLQSSIRSIVLDHSDSAFYCNYIMDDQNRLILCYTTKRNGINDNVILKLSYPSADTIVFSLYDYDWESKTDSLLQENRINVITGGGIVTYKNQGATESDLSPLEQEYQDLWNKWKASIDNAAAKVQVISTFNRLSSIWTRNIASAVTNATFVNIALKETLTSIRESIVKSRTDGVVPISTYEDTYGINTTPPKSPTSTSIPNPTGTPTNPVGSVYSVLVGNWNYFSPVNETELPYDQWVLINGYYIKINGKATILKWGNVYFQRTYSWYNASTPNESYNTMISFYSGKLTGDISGTNDYEVDISHATLNILEDGVYKECQPTLLYIQHFDSNYINFRLQYTWNDDGILYSIDNVFKRN